MIRECSRAYSGATVLKAIVERAGIDPAQTSETIRQAAIAQGQNPGRQAHIHAGHAAAIVPPGSINQVCGWALRTVGTGGPARGSWAMPPSWPPAARRACGFRPMPRICAPAEKMGDMKFIDIMIKDGLWDAFNGYHMGHRRERRRNRWQISREQQDEFAPASQNKAEAAQKAGKFRDEIVALHRQDPQG